MEISFWKHHPQIDQNGSALAQATIHYQQRFNFDFVKLTPAGTWLAVCYGALDECKGDHLGRRAIVKPVVTNWKTWQQLPLFGKACQPEMLTQQLIASRLVCQAINDVDICATVFSPLSQAIQLAGLDTFLEHIDRYPEAVDKGLQRITQNTAYVLDQLAHTGVKRLFYVMQHAQQNILPSSQYERIAAHHDETCLRHSASIFFDTLVHLHGENIYWGLTSPIDRVRLHYGIHSTNPTPAELNRRAQLPVVAGLPIHQLTGVQSAHQVHQLLDQYELATQCKPLLTGNCVLPLNFSDEQTDFWIQSLAQWAN